MLRVILVVLPLGLDTFAVSAALGIAGLAAERRLRVSAVFTAFEVTMPLVGLIAGAALGRALGGIAEYVALATLAGVGVYILVSPDEPGRALLERSGGTALLGLGLGLSIDELAMGFSLGMLGSPVLAAIVLIGVQAFVFSQLGLRLGGRLGVRFREGAERLAGVLLIALAGLLLALRAIGASL